MSNSTLFSATTLARLLNLTERRIQQLAKEGIIPKGVRGQYSLGPCVQNYVKYLQERNERPVRLGAEDLQQERKRLLKAQADMVECEHQAKRGELVELSAVTYFLQEIASVYTSSLDAIPARFSQELVSIANPAVMKSKLFDECRRIRNSTADELQRWSEDFARRANLDPTIAGTVNPHP